MTNLTNTDTNAFSSENEWLRHTESVLRLKGYQRIDDLHYNTVPIDQFEKIARKFYDAMIDSF